MRRHSEKTDQTRQNLLEAFWSLYAKKGMGGITVKEIVAVAGYNRATFYEYFGGVHDCLESIEIRILPKLDELPAPGEDGSSAGLVESFMALYEDKLEYYDVLLGEGGDPSFQRRLIDSVKSTLHAALPDRASLTGRELIQLDFTLEYLLCGMVGLLRHYFRATHGLSTLEVLAVVHEIIHGDTMAKLRDLMSPGP